MKKAIFLLPALAFVGFLAFCTKSDVQNELATKPSNVTATDRIDTVIGGGGSTGVCCFNVFSDNVHDIRFCGTNQNAIPCADCIGGQAVGVNVVVGNGAQVCVTPSTQFYVTTASPGGSYIRLVGVGTPPNWIHIPAGTCQAFEVDANCNITPI